MRIGRILGDLARASIIYALTAFASGGVLDPVRTAAADPLPLPDADKGDDQTVTFDAVCDGKFEKDGVTHYFARHGFDRPLSPRQLSGVRVLARIADASAPPGFPYALVTKGIFVREGGVAVDCGNERDGKAYETVTFVVPRVYKLDVDTTSPW